MTRGSVSGSLVELSYKTDDNVVDSPKTMSEVPHDRYRMMQQQGSEKPEEENEQFVVWATESVYPIFLVGGCTHRRRRHLSLHYISTVCKIVIVFRRSWFTDRLGSLVKSASCKSPAVPQKTSSTVDWETPEHVQVVIE